jgi:hypothetical protein
VIHICNPSYFGGEDQNKASPAKKKAQFNKQARHAGISGGWEWKVAWTTQQNPVSRTNKKRVT